MSRFNTTQWSLVLGARSGDGSARAALESLCRTYRPPVLAYIGSRGYRGDVAEDLTQAFFERLLERGDFSKADPSRGRFRAYLLTALKHFLINFDTELRTEKRGGRVQFESLESGDGGGVAIAAEGADPEQVFEQAWGLVVLDSALRRLRKEAHAAGKAGLFERLRDFLAEAPAPADYARVAAALSLRPNTVAVSVHRLRHRLRELVRTEVAETAADESAFDIELRELRRSLGAVAE